MTRRIFVFALLLSLLAPAAQAGAVLADDLRDIEVAAAAERGAPSGAHLTRVVVPFDHDVPEMPSLLAIDSPVEARVLEAPRRADTLAVESPVAAPRVVRARGRLDRGPPVA